MIHELLSNLALQNSLAIFLSGFAITYFVIPSILEVAYKKQLFDVPDHRKVHVKPIPSLGGIGIFIGVIISVILFSYDSGYPYYKFLIAGYLVLFFMGLKDDLIIMRTRYKLIIQVLVTIILVISGLRFENLHGVLGFYELPYWFSVTFSLIFIIGITNAFNLIDGIDGLASGLGIINCMTFGCLLFIFEQYAFSSLAFAVAGSMLAFLRYNFNTYPNKIFMGDTGSLLLGLSISVLAISYVNIDPKVAAEGFGFASPPIVALAIVIIPVFDTLRVMIVRILQGKSPFKPDKNHIHHTFLEAGLTHKTSSFVLYGINLLLISAVLFLRNNSAFFLVFALLILGAIVIQGFILLRFKLKTQKIDSLRVQANQLSSNKYLK